jgi:type IX secretion system PorP/SprF family membrane protein
MIAIHGIVFSQQYPQFTQYTYNMNIVNPAYAGSRESLSINMLGKKQWVGVEGSPETATFSIHSPVGKNVGLGLSAIYDQLGPLKETHIYGDFSYTLQLSNKGKLALGLKGGVSFQNIDPSLFRFNENESTPNDFVNKTSPNIGVGAYYYQENFYIGASIPNILDTSFFERESGAVSRVSKSTAFFLTSGYVFKMHKDLQIKPAAMIRYSEGSPVSVDVSGTVFIQNNLEIGLSYRYEQSLNFMTAIFVNDNFRVGYAYDYSVGKLSNFNNGSHEILLLFDLANGERGRRRLVCF